MNVYILESRMLASGEGLPSPWAIEAICNTPILAMELAESGREVYLEPLKFAPMPDFGQNMRMIANDGDEEWRIREFKVEME